MALFRRYLEGKVGDNMQVGDVIIWRNDLDYLGILVENTEKYMVVKPLSPRFVEEMAYLNIKGDWKINKRLIALTEWRKLCKNSK